MMAMSASEARKRLFPLIEQVNDDQEPIEIVSKARHRLPGVRRPVALAHGDSLPPPVAGQRGASAAQHRGGRSRSHRGPGADRPSARRRVKISFTRDGWEDYTSWANERRTSSGSTA